MRKRRIAALATTIMVAAAGALTGQAAANATTLGPFEIISQHSGKCLDVYNWSKAAGANIDQWTCGNKQANQEWRLIENSSSAGTFWIQNVNSGMCLEPETPDWGALIVQNPCNPNDIFQSWVVAPGTGSSNVTYQNLYYGANPSGALDVNGASTANHAWIDVWYLNWASNQLWNRPPGF